MATSRAATRVAPSAMTGLGRERLSPWYNVDCVFVCVCVCTLDKGLWSSRVGASCVGRPTYVCAVWAPLRRVNTYTLALYIYLRAGGVPTRHTHKWGTAYTRLTRHLLRTLEIESTHTMADCIWCWNRETGIASMSSLSLSIVICISK